MRYLHRLLLPFAAVGLTVPVAGVAQVPRTGCYATEAGRAMLRYFTPAEERDVLVLIDRTVAYPSEVRDQVLRQILRMGLPGTRITVGSFSTHSGNTYPRISLSHFFEPDLPQALSTRVPRVYRNRLRMCLSTARISGLRQLRRVLGAEFASADPSISRSYIMSSIRQFGERVAGSRARRKTVVIVSDMLENSSTSNFYAGGFLRTLDPRAEFLRARTGRLLANLAGAEVYVIGMGLVQPSTRHIVSTDSLERLEQFWRNYFAASRASRVIVGRPLLLRDIP